MSKIVITGGHHNSALVVAKLLRDKGMHIEWIGHRYSAKNDQNDSAEYLEVKASNFPFHNLVAGKLTTNLANLLSIPIGFYRAWRYLRQLHPIAVVSFGGYLGLSVSLPAYLMGIPVYLHEQTLVVGKANRLSAKFARRIYLTWEQSTRYFQQSKTKLVGLPLRDSILQAKPKKLFPNNLPTVLVLCGKQGSQTINKYIFEALPRILEQYNIIHQTGMSSVTKDYERSLALRDGLSESLSTSYLPLSYIGEADIGMYLSSASLVVGRSGAHTAYELGVLGKKALLIPFMYTTGREQYRQAKLLEEAGYAQVLLESDLSVDKLLDGIDRVYRMPLPTKKLNLQTNAANLLVDDLLIDLHPYL